MAAIVSSFDFGSAFGRFPFLVRKLDSDNCRPGFASKWWINLFFCILTVSHISSFLGLDSDFLALLTFAGFKHWNRKQWPNVGDTTLHTILVVFCQITWCSSAHSVNCLFPLFPQGPLPVDRSTLVILHIFSPIYSRPLSEEDIQVQPSFLKILVCTRKGEKRLLLSHFHNFWH